MEVLIASSNHYKVAEFRRIFIDSPIELRTPAELGVQPLNVAETGETFLANAGLKANAYSRAYRMPALADDSGICVDILAGAPGVRSARFGSPRLDDAGRLRYLLSCLTGVEDHLRTAHYVCALVLAWPNGELFASEAAWYGHVATESRPGETGFGYDPVFLLPAPAKAVSEVPPELKDSIGHRGKSARRLLAQLGL